MNKIMYHSIALLCLAGSVAVAFETDFNSVGSLNSEFNLTTTSDTSMYEVEGVGLNGSRALALPYAKHSRAIATTKDSVSTWSEGSTVTVAAYFQPQMPDYPAPNRRALALGIANHDTVESKPITLKDPVYPIDPTVFAGIYPRSFNQEAQTIAVDFHLSTSQPDLCTSLTSNPIELKSGEWYFMEIAFTENSGNVKVEMAIAEVDNNGNLIELLYRGEHGYGKTAVGFNEGDALHAFIYSRDPDHSGIKLVDDFRAE